MQITFLKTKKPRQFEYKPRYYDEEKERKENRRKEMERSGKGDTSFMRSEIDRRWRKIDKKNSDKAKGVHLLLYLAIIAALVYFMFFV